MARKQLFIDPITVRRYLHYDPETGLFTKLSDGERVLAGFVYKPKAWDAYMRIQIEGVFYAAHRLAWVYMTGEQPDVVDHINGLRHDNRFVNLRNGTYSDNARNKAHHRKAAGTYIEHPDADFY